MKSLKWSPLLKLKKSILINVKLELQHHNQTEILNIKKKRIFFIVFFIYLV